MNCRKLVIYHLFTLKESRGDFYAGKKHQKSRPGRECVENVRLKISTLARDAPSFGEEIRVSKCWKISRAGDSTRQALEPLQA
jgi:hypothetical protein